MLLEPPDLTGQEAVPLWHADAIPARVGARSGGVRTNAPNSPAPLRQSAIGRVKVRSGQGHWIEDATSDYDAVQKLLPIFVWDAKHFTDDHNGQGMRKVTDHVHCSARRDSVEQAFDNGLDARSHIFDAAGGEGLGHQTA